MRGHETHRVSVMSLGENMAVLPPKKQLNVRTCGGILWLIILVRKLINFDYNYISLTP